MSEPDMKAKRYERGNGRFDLMTDEEVRTFISDDFSLILSRMTYSYQQGETSMGYELYHQLHELYIRYPDSTFRLEVIPNGLAGQASS